ncbi:hypothetical protein A2645_00915 [Candidatus Nomurabacteria bacterium RIFCSPHIGHO2_01_FULL_39_9]|uniref:Uncharacterized protein n=1 Tax=Candidatus Nomurabacteria bacterium RIFCSPHIGHO2_01_FULL_39_9 TaxID=1801735 RepID=A0A1F6UXI2_9BACT|nr:MAG: hypothetical protein A2645_00915 [Candidatus Nomurabacteria bacterium RIFCSPHIGHO2_01_FULL_39_9]
MKKNLKKEEKEIIETIAFLLKELKPPSRSKLTDYSFELTGTMLSSDYSVELKSIRIGKKQKEIKIGFVPPDMRDKFEYNVRKICSFFSVVIGYTELNEEAKKIAKIYFQHPDHDCIKKDIISSGGHIFQLGNYYLRFVGDEMDKPKYFYLTDSLSIAENWRWKIVHEMEDEKNLLRKEVERKQIRMEVLNQCINQARRQIAKK